MQTHMRIKRQRLNRLSTVRIADGDRRSHETHTEGVNIQMSQAFAAGRQAQLETKFTPPIDDPHEAVYVVCRRRARKQSMNLKPKVHVLQAFAEGHHVLTTKCKTARDQPWMQFPKRIDELPTDAEPCPHCCPNLVMPLEPRDTSVPRQTHASSSGSASAPPAPQIRGMEWLDLSAEEQSAVACEIDKDTPSKTRRRRSGGILTATLGCGLLVDWIEIWHGEKLAFVYIRVLRLLKQFAW